MTRVMKDSGIQWIGNIPQDWNTIKIDSIYSERRTKVNDVDYPPLSVTKRGVLPQLENVAKSDNSENRKLVKTNDFVINSRSDRKGSCGISSLDGSVSLINTVLIPKLNMNNVFYNFVFKSEQFSDEFYKWGHGIVADLWTTKWSDMKNIYVPYPSVQTQKKIADYLDDKCGKIDQAIEGQKKIIEKLKEYKQSVITEAVTKGLDPNVPMKDSGIEWIGQIPEHWGLKKLKYILEQRNEKTNDTTLQYIGLENVVSYAGICCESSGEIVSEGINNICHTGDILFGKLRPYLAKCIISDFDGACSGEFLVLKSCQGNKKYYHRVLLSYWFIDIVNSSTYGTKMPRANWSFISNVPLPVPPEAEQDEISAYLDAKLAEIESAIKQKEETIEKLTEYKKSLIYECVTGKKDIV